MDATEPVIPTETEPVITGPVTPATDADLETQSLDSFAEQHQTAATRHRARSQKATPADVEVIAAETKRLREIEDSFGIERKDGESERAFNLRKRAEIAEIARKAKEPPPAAPAREPEGVRPPVVAAPVVKAAKDDPEPDEAKFENYTDFLEARARWVAREEFRTLRAETEKATKEAESQAKAADEQRAMTEAFTAAKTRYADFESVAFGDAPWAEGSPIDTWIRGRIRTTGADVLYHLKKHPNEAKAIMAMTDPFEQIEELSSLSRRLAPRTAAVTTGAAPAEVTKPVPRPPTPVRTGSMRAADEPPELENLSLAEFGKTFGAPKRRG